MKWKDLYLREMNQMDFDSLCKILQDEEAMYAYEGAFSDDEVQCGRSITEAMICCITVMRCIVDNMNC